MKTAIQFFLALVVAVLSSLLLPKEHRKPFFLEAGGILIFFAVLTLAGCGTLSDPAKPRTAAEEFPLRNQDPRVGLVVNNGTAPMNLFVYDQANRLVEQIYLSGAERHIVSGKSGQPYPQYWMRLLEPGCYRLESFPFFMGIWLVPPTRGRVDLPKQIYSLCVGNNPTAQYYGGRHWGWLLYVGADMPGGGVGNGNPFPALIQFVNPFSR